MDDSHNEKAMDELAKDRLGVDGDAVYEALLAAHAGLSPAESHTLNARLVLLLANHIGEKSELLRLFALARGTFSEK